MDARLFMCVVLFLSLTFKVNLINGATDTITASQSLSGNQTIISAGGVFKLGFFKPGNSSNNYIGMWYNKLPQQTIVWVANRETPILDEYSSQLRILNGNIVLLNESKIPIWSTNLNPSTSNTLHIVLGDDGNLVLKDGYNGNLSEILWQSFDNPADTWLPGSKIAFDNRTKINQQLISWKNSDDPAPGLFSLKLDPNELRQYIIQWNETETYWTSGIWNGQIFSKVPEMRANYIYNFSYISNINQTYFTYSLYDTSTISRFVMDVSGQIKQISWLEPSDYWNLFWSQPRQQCEVYAFCGSFGSCNNQLSTPCICLEGYVPKSKGDWDLKDYSADCVRNTPLQCEQNSTNTKGKSDILFAVPNIILPEFGQPLNVGSGKACAMACMANCSCSAYAFEDNVCSVWTQDVLNLQQLDTSGKTFYIKLSGSEITDSKKISKTLIGVIIGLIVVAILLGIIIFYVWKRRRPVGPTKIIEDGLVSFMYHDLQIATKNFSDKLGGGGFGSVFKGTLPNSTVIAVKRLEGISQGEKQFRSEVSTIGTIQHVNLVRLRGFCSEGSKKLLVYDYMPNNSLNVNLFTEENSYFNSKSMILDWKTRFSIALGIARGLVYLHEECRDCIIHCDIKPENILLDADFCPKVADFGLAKLVGREFSRVLTTMRGTRGYLAPEWISGVAITSKADVYSYGMMLFEIVSGKRNSRQSEDGKINFFPTFAVNKIIENEDLSCLLDERLGVDTVDKEELIRVCRIACWCIQDDETHRPSMSQVVQMLGGVLEVKLPSLPRSLQLFVDDHEDIVFFTETSMNQTSKTQTTSNSSGASSSLNKSSTSSSSSKL